MLLPVAGPVLLGRFVDDAARPASPVSQLTADRRRLPRRHAHRRRPPAARHLALGAAGLAGRQPAARRPGPPGPRPRARLARRAQPRSADRADRRRHRRPHQVLLDRRAPAARQRRAAGRRARASRSSIDWRAGLLIGASAVGRRRAPGQAAGRRRPRPRPRARGARPPLRRPRGAPRRARGPAGQRRRPLRACTACTSTRPAGGTPPAGPRCWATAPTSPPASSSPSARPRTLGARRLARCARASSSIGSVLVLFRFAQMVREPLERIAEQMREFQKAVGRRPPGRPPAGHRADDRRRPGHPAAGRPAVGRAARREPRLRRRRRRRGRGAGPPRPRPAPRAPARCSACVGRTGSGKTSLGRLLLRFWDSDRRAPSALGGVDLRDTDRRRPAPPGRRGHPGGRAASGPRCATTSRCSTPWPADDDAPARRCSTTSASARGWPACPTASTPSSPAATRLSAGEAQLLAFARVLLADPGLVVLDEASSRLDPDTEARVTAATDRLLAGRTVVVIAHRLATLDRVDEILVLDHGRIVEHGARADLARRPRQPLPAAARGSSADAPTAEVAVMAAAGAGRRRDRRALPSSARVAWRHRAAASRSPTSSPGSAGSCSSSVPIPVGLLLKWVLDNVAADPVDGPSVTTVLVVLGAVEVARWLDAARRWSCSGTAPGSAGTPSPASTSCSRWRSTRPGGRQAARLAGRGGQPLPRRLPGPRPGARRVARRVGRRRSPRPSALAIMATIDLRTTLVVVVPVLARGVAVPLARPRCCGPGGAPPARPPPRSPASSATRSAPSPR